MLVIADLIFVLLKTTCSHYNYYASRDFSLYYQDDVQSRSRQVCVGQVRVDSTSGSDCVNTLRTVEFECDASAWTGHHISLCAVL